jgi:adenylate kinase family enzyme
MVLGLSLEAPVDILRKRALGRGLGREADKNRTRGDDNEKTIDRRLVEHERHSADISNAFSERWPLLSIDANQELNTVLSSALDAIQSAAPS